ncbi:MAG: HEAT repeat domain-containing protein [Anaerolineae bacterium]|nr:HEAT repeat domain-containing protein [Anaerolineae bacterium]MCI0609468.1 HEAT repeat domain-containing protein [Anaerolineae bacterium]
MLREKAVTLLKIRPDEVRMVVLMAALFLFVQAGQGIGENAAFALFLAGVDVDRLPYMYMGLGGVVFLASIAYSASLSRFRDASVVLNLMAGAAVLFVIERAAIALFGAPVYSVLWLTTFGMSVVIGTLLWTVAGEVCDARQAKRLFPLFTSMGILGSVLGNLFTGIAASLAGTANLIVLYVILLSVGFFLIRAITRSYFRPKAIGKTKFSLIDDMRAGYEFVRESRLFSLIAWSSILYSVLFFTVDFPFSQIVSLQYSDDAAGLAGFKGLFTSITTAVTFLVSLFLANRLYTRLGIVNSILIMSITYVVGFIVFFVSFTFGGAIIARFSQLVVLGGIMGTAWNALFNVAPPERRGQILAFNNGVPAQIGVVVSGLLIILSNTILADTRVVLILGASVALLSVYLTMKMKPAYGEALLSALRAGRIEVFSNEEEAFSGYQNDPAALQVILKALRDPKAITRRLAAEMLAKMGNSTVIPDLVTLLSDPDASVRTAATSALADLGAKHVLQEIIPGLDDPDDSVREQTLVSLPRLEVDSSPDLISTLERLLKDPNLGIRVRAAEVLLFLDDNKSAELSLYDLLKDGDVHQRRVALESLGRIVTRERLPSDVHLILDALKDPSPIVRREAARVVVLVKKEGISEYLENCLSDVDAGVRNIASESLKQAWPQSRSAVFRILEDGGYADGIQINSALDSIPLGDPEVLDPLRKYIQREVADIRYFRSIVASLPLNGSAVRLLRDTMKSRESLSEERVIKAVGLFGNPRAMDLVRKSLNAGNPGTRAAALEALETLGDKKVTFEVLPILDRGGIFEADGDQALGAAEVIRTLLSDNDYWLRALATRSVSDLGLEEFRHELRRIKSDPSPLVRQAAVDSLDQLEGDKTMKTLKTLSTLERILLLREVPMFSKLAPQDLEQIAEIAHEQLYSPRAVICRDGDPGNTLFIIVHGSVDVIKEKDKQETVIAMRDAGEFVGEMAILESAPRSATLRAHTPVRMLVIEGNAFNTILLDRPEVAVSVLRHMSTRVRELNDRVSASLSRSDTVV